jgi:hypothetical protein
MSAWFLVLLVVLLLFSFVLLRGAPYVPSRRNYLRRALTHLYKVGPKDVLVDVGSGDGVVLRMAASMGARAIGYELNPALVGLSKLLAIGNTRVKTVLADFWLVSLPTDTTVVYVFMVQKMSRRLEKKLQDFADQRGRSLNVVAYGIPFQQRQPDKTFEAYFLYVFQPLQSR